MFGKRKSIAERQQQVTQLNEQLAKREETRIEKFFDDFLEVKLPTLFKRGMRKARKSYFQGGFASAEVPLPKRFANYLVCSSERRNRTRDALEGLTSGTDYTATVHGEHALTIKWVEAPQ